MKKDWCLECGRRCDRQAYAIARAERGVVKAAMAWQSWRNFDPSDPSGALICNRLAEAIYRLVLARKRAWLLELPQEKLKT